MEPLELFGANVAEIETVLERPKRNQDICACGHSIARHYEISQGQTLCQVAKMFCPCRHMVAVVNVDDTRVFMYDTHGRGSKHALFRGLKRLGQMKKTSRSLIPNECWACGEIKAIEPVPITEMQTISDLAQARNAMLCEECVWRMLGVASPSGVESASSGLDSPIVPEVVASLSPEPEVNELAVGVEESVNSEEATPWTPWGD
jgi:hypothetical protein